METATATTDVEQIRRKFEECLQRKREWGARFSHAMAMAFVLNDFTELDRRETANGNGNGHR